MRVHSESESMTGSETASEEEEEVEDPPTAVPLDDPTKLQQLAMGADLSAEAISKAKQSRSEKKARKAMLKLGLKPFPGI